MPNSYSLGALIEATGTYTDSDGNAQDPTAVYFEVLDPSGNEDSYEYTVDAEVVKESTGVYYVRIDADEVGWWCVRTYSTGTGQAAAEGKFLIKESAFD